MSKKIVFALFSFLFCLQLASAQQQSITTSHGFRFINHTDGKGDKPKPGETVMVHVDTYIGDTLMGSTRSDGGYIREYILPDSIRAGKRIPFLYDAVLLMSEGDSASVFEKIDSTLRLFVPASQKDAQEVRYEVKVVEIITKAEKAKQVAESEARMITVQTMVQATIQDYTAGKLNDKLLMLSSGLKILVVEPGTGPAVNTGETVKTHYLGALMDGKMFDNSFQRGQTLDFAVGVGQMIAGFDEGVTKINHGGKAYFFLPYKLAYGREGNPTAGIPRKSDLVFYVELL